MWRGHLPLFELHGCKHGKGGNSWSLLMFKWKWSQTIYSLWIYEIEIHKHLENIWIYKAKQFMSSKNNFKQRISIVDVGASGEQVVDIE